MIVTSFFWTQYRNVTDGRTDRPTDGQNNALGSQLCGRAVKIENNQ